MNLPNQLSLLRIILTPVFIYCLTFENHTLKIVSFFIFCIASLTDYYDGKIARKYGYVTTWGQFIDPLADKFLVLSGLALFSIWGYFPVWTVIVILIRDVFMTFIRWIAIKRECPVKTNYFAKIKTVSQLALLVFIFIFHLFTWDKVFADYSVFMLKIRELHIFSMGAYFVTLMTVMTGIIYWIHNRETITGFFSSKS